MGQCQSKSSAEDILLTKKEPDSLNSRKTSATGASSQHDSTHSSTYQQEDPACVWTHQDDDEEEDEEVGDSSVSEEEDDDEEFTVMNAAPVAVPATLSVVCGDGTSTVGPSVQTIKASNQEGAVQQRQEKEGQRLDRLLTKNYYEHHTGWSCVGSRMSALDQVDEDDAEAIWQTGDEQEEDQDIEEALFHAVYKVKFDTNKASSEKRDPLVLETPPAQKAVEEPQHHHKTPPTEVTDVDAALFAAMEAAHDAKFKSKKNLFGRKTSSKSSKDRDKMSLEYFFGEEQSQPQPQRPSASVEC